MSEKPGHLTDDELREWKNRVGAPARLLESMRNQVTTSYIRYDEGPADKRKVEVERFEQIVEAVRSEFPELRIERPSDQPHYDAFAEIPAQAGLEFPVSINLQNCDELHLVTSHFWVEWFPCRHQEVCDRFLEALRGLLSGRFRIRQSFVGNRVVKAQLQCPTGAGLWETVATSSSLGILIPWKRTRRFVQNRPGA